MTTIQSNLLKLLNKVKHPGKFYSTGQIPACYPGLEITDVGHISFPLASTQAKKIIKKNSRAPFGQGEETLVDTSVRKAWQIEATSMQFHNPQWQSHLESIVDDIKQQLGVNSKDKVIFELYKGLLYEKGDFFIAHRDTEKLDNMFATLVIVLPSAHQGGELIVEHDGMQQTLLVADKSSEYNISYAAFYADCKHEVKPLLQGYRFCLVYNLALANMKKKPPNAPSSGAEIKAIEKLLKPWSTKRSEPEKLVMMLKHQYSENSLSLNNLKNLDRAQAHVLFEAAKLSECDAHLTLLTFWQSGDADDYSYDRRSRYYDDYQDDDLSMMEVYDEALSVDHWITADGETREYGKMSVNDDELIKKHDFSEDTPDEQESGGPTGNEGCSLEYWYHRAAIVLWPKQQLYPILSTLGQSHAIPGLEVMLNEWHKTGDDTLKQSCQQFAISIIKQWCFEPLSKTYGNEINQADKMLQALTQLGDMPLIKKFIKTILAEDFLGTEGKSIELSAQKLGWKELKTPLLSLAKNSIRCYESIAILHYLCCHSDTIIKAPDFCHQYSLLSLNTIKEYDAGTNKPYHHHASDRAKMLETYLQCLITLEEEKIITQIITYVLTKPKLYTLHTVCIPVVRKINAYGVKSNALAYQELGTYCLNELTSLANEKIKKPSNWAQKINSSCACADCVELIKFTKSTEEKEHHFRVKKSRRQHLHNKIQYNNLDMTHITQRTGSPFTLVCCKNFSSYDNKVTQQKVDQALLKELSELINGL